MSDLDPQPIYDATVLDHGIIPDPPTRELGSVRVVTHPGMDRPDVPLLPLVGPQSPGSAW